MRKRAITPTLTVHQYVFVINSDSYDVHVFKIQPLEWKGVSTSSIKQDIEWEKICCLLETFAEQLYEHAKAPQPTEELQYRK